MRAPLTYLILLFLVATSLESQNFLRSYAPITGLNLGRAEAIEDLGMLALSSPSLHPGPYKWQTAASFRQFTFGEYALQNFQAAYRSRIFKNQHMGFQAMYSGNQAVGILQLSANYGRKLFENVNLGIQLNYGQLNIDAYESENNLTLDLALSSEPITHLHIGAWVRHMFQVKGQSLENASILISSKYHLSQNFRIYASFYKNIVSPLQIGVGAYYRIQEVLDLKLAYHPNLTAFTIGFGLHFDDSWGIHSAAHLHPNLGLQAGMGAYYQSKQ